MIKLQFTEIKQERIEYWRTTDLAGNFPVHFHDYWLAGKLEQGLRHVYLRDKDFFLGPDSLLLLNAGEVHACAGILPGGIWQCLHFSKCLIKALFPDRKRIFAMNQIFDPDLVSMFEWLVKKLKTGGAFTKGEVVSFIAKAAAFGAEESRGKNILDLSREFDPVTTSLDSLSRSFGRGKFRFIHQFVNEYGISPHKYIINMRLISARKLLANGALPVNAALESGFYDQAHFSKTFITNLGYTPGIYQKALYAHIRKQGNQ